nr:uncharacterized protein LOC117466353 [Pseudochaenichthys georgianus]
MDSADSQTLRAALCSQAQRLRQQEEEMKDTNQGPAAFPSDLAKVAFVVSHLTGRVEAWATAEWARESPVCKSLQLFTETIKKIFDRTTPGTEAARALTRLTTADFPSRSMTEVEHAVILGYPWSCKHNPHIDWRTGKVLGWGSECSHSCFRGKTAEIVREPIIDNDREHEDNQDSDFPDLSNVPSCYRDLKEVFNKTKATSLPPHRTYDCAIDLLPGSPLPKGRLYSLSAPERESMREYIDGSLKTGLIRPSSSPAGAGFFFVEKKDGSLRPCIDYSPLNDITIKNRYPLPLMTSAFELLKGARVFSKLDLRNAYHLVRIREGDEWKTGFNTPSGHYEYLVHTFRMFVRY